MDDVRLALRVLAYLRHYPKSTAAAIVMMIGAALTSVFSIGMLKPVLDLVFEKKVATFHRQVANYPLTIEASQEGSGAIAASGFLFLPQHVEALLAAVQPRASMVPPPVAIELSLAQVHFAGAEALQHLRDSLPPGVALVDAPAPSTFRDDAVGLQDRWKVWGMDRLAYTLEDLGRNARTDDHFAFRLLIYTLLFFIGLTFVKVFFAFSAEFFARRIGFGTVELMRRETYSHLLRQDFHYFSRRPVGELMSIVNNDIMQVQQIVSMAFTQALQTPIRFVITLVAMIIVSPMLTLLSAFAIIPLAALLLAISRKVRKTSRRAQEQRAALSIVLQETFSGIRTVKAYNMEAHESERFASRSRQLFRQQFKGSIYSEAASQFNEIVMTILVAGIVLLGGFLVLVGTATYRLEPSMYIVFLLLLVELFRPLRAWSKSLIKIQTGLAGAERVFRVQDQHPRVVDAPDAIDFTGLNTSIRFEHVGFEYEAGRPVLRDIHLDVPQGSVVALVGPAGCGKSTLINLIPRFYDVTSGRILVGGEDVRRYTLRSLRNHISIVSQHVVIFDDTVRSNIAYGRADLPIEQVIEAAKAANIHREIMALPHGYDTRVGGEGMRLSGGQRQRVAIARALLKNPPILILDEATSALDVENERLIQESLERLMEGRTVVMVAHRLSTIRNANLICVLKDGAIVERGSHEELLAHGGLYAEFWRISQTRQLEHSSPSFDESQESIPSALPEVD